MACLSFPGGACRTLSWIILPAFRRPLRQYCRLRSGCVLAARCRRRRLDTSLQWMSSGAAVAGLPAHSRLEALAYTTASPLLRVVSPSRCRSRGDTRPICDSAQPQSHSIDRVLRYFQPVRLLLFGGAAPSFPLRRSSASLCLSVLPPSRGLFPRRQSGRVKPAWSLSNLRHPTSPFNVASSALAAPARANRSLATSTSDFD